MDKKSIIGIVLIAAIVILWGVWSTPSKEQMAAQNRRLDSIAQIEKQKVEQKAAVQKKEIAAATNDTIAQDSTFKNNDSTSNASLKSEFGVFACAKQAENKFIIVESDFLKVKFSNKGGKIASVELKNYKDYLGKPLVLFDGDTNRFGLIFTSDSKLISTNDLYFNAVSFDGKPITTDALKIEKDSSTISFRLYPENGQATGKYIEYTYTIKNNSFMVGYDVKIINLGNEVVTNSNSIDFEWELTLHQKEKYLKNERIVSTVYFKHSVDKEVDYLSETKADEKNIPTQLDWISFKQQFFTTIFVSNEKFTNASLKVTPDTNTGVVKLMQAELGLPYSKGQVEPISSQFYFGPSKYKTLKQFDQDFEKQIPLGWGILSWFNKILVIPVFNFLEGFNMNYGIIILLLTIFIKVLLFPIAYKTYVSSAKMKVLKPEIDEINAKFPKSEDAMKKQQTTMALYKKAGVNPMAGCIPMLLQIPILFALFRFFPASFELRQQGFLWADDLSSYDSIYSWTTQIPILSSVYGNHISLFTILMTISSLIYTRMNMDTMGSSNQMPGMKTMMYIMPLMFLGIFNSNSSGLSYYYFLANMITFGQQIVIKKYFVDEKKLHLQIQENKKKNFSKKSKFQAKLEEMAKKRGYNPNK
ncbi:MAG: membrane protein insertase YidC [Bacteroidota bacterium]